MISNIRKFFKINEIYYNLLYFDINFIKMAHKTLKKTPIFND